MILPFDKIVGLLRCPSKHIFSCMKQLIIDIITHDQCATEEFIKAGILDVFEEIFCDGSMDLKKNCVVILEAMAANIGPPLYGPILPYTIDMLHSGNDDICGSVMRLFYRFFTACDDDEAVDAMKHEFADNDGLDTLNDFLDNEELSETAQQLLDLFQDDEDADGD